MQAVPSNNGKAATYQPVPTKTEQVLKEVNETVDIAQDNIQKLMARGENLEQLQGKTENLATQANRFKKSAKEVRRKMWWQNVKMQVCLACLVLFLLAVVILIVLWQTGALRSAGSSAPPAATPLPSTQ
ncbi:hypothetical protein SpCBS45565_g04782 [Spizellomyces sp. 'palustris']|nr:hypothetical protein SpCBS45565_g04782 [Spizellomyces sp. 'palustris']